MKIRKMVKLNIIIKCAGDNNEFCHPSCLFLCHSGRTSCRIDTNDPPILKAHWKPRPIKLYIRCKKCIKLFGIKNEIEKGVTK